MVSNRYCKLWTSNFMTFFFKNPKFSGKKQKNKIATETYCAKSSRAISLSSSHGQLNKKEERNKR